MTVVVPLYQAARYIGETLDSVAAQTRPPDEVIVVDDGSTDGGADVAGAHPLRPRVLRQQNRGPAAARNAAVAAATGDVVALLDADDLWYPHKLERQLRAFDERPELGWAFGGYTVFEDGPDGRSLLPGPRLPGPPTLRDFLLLGNRVATLTVAVRRGVWSAVGAMDEDPALIGIEDLAMWLRLARRHAVHYDPEPLALYRLHPGNLVGANVNRATLLETRAVARFLAGEPRLTRELFGVPTGAFQRLRVITMLREVLGGVRRFRPSTLGTIARAWAAISAEAAPGRLEPGSPP